MKKWLTTMGEWLKKQFGQKPINIIGPFTFPAPDDPRWIGIADDKHIIYSLDEIKCFMYGWTAGGFVLVGGIPVNDITDPRTNHLSPQAERYATAVEKAYKLAHPKSNLRLQTLNIDRVTQILASINQRDPVPGSKET
jgi:hypothetical protein